MAMRLMPDSDANHAVKLKSVEGLQVLHDTDVLVGPSIGWHLGNNTYRAPDNEDEEHDVQPAEQQFTGTQCRDERTSDRRASEDQYHPALRGEQPELGIRR